MPEQKTIGLVDSLGVERAVPESEVEYRLGQGWKPQTAEGKVARLSAEAEEDKYGGLAGGAVAGVTSILGGATGGASDVFLRAAGVGDRVAKSRQHHEGVSTAGSIAGGLTGVGKIAGKLGAKVAGTGGGVVSQLARTGVGGVVEGGIQGLGQGVSEVALSDDPLTIERIGSTLGSSAFYGGLAGGAASVAGKGLELGLGRAKRALDEAANVRQPGAFGEISDDLATLDRKGLRAAEKAEIDAVEAARVPQRAEVAGELRAFRKELKEQKVWLATKGVDDAELKAAAIGKRTLKADKALDNLLDDPKALAENPKAALAHLRKQEAALDELVNKHGPRLREKFATDTSGDRIAALDNAAAGLERNRALQSKIADLSSKPASPRLQQIADAVDALSAPKPSGGLAGELLGGSVFGHVATAFSGLPVIGPMIGAKAAGLAQKLVSGKMGAAAAEAAARGSKAVGAFLDVTRKVQPALPVLATKVLGGVRYSMDAPERRKAKGEKRRQTAPDLATAYRARTAEIRAAVEPTPDGKVQMRMSVRQQVADRLSPIRAAHPVMADRLEAIAAKRVEFLAGKMPRRPDLPGMNVGPDTWQPSDMEMRGWARYVAAVEDPHGVIERLADGTVTPEDAETMQEVYPEMYADVQQQIMMQLGELRAKLPFQRRLALSIFSGVPVDPSLDPRVLAALQGTFAAEAGTEGGVQAPRAQPAFGSVRADIGTPSQQRQEGTR